MPLPKTRPLGESYFIRLKDDKDCFVHVVKSTDNANEDEYIIGKGVAGACLFTFDNATLFIQHAGASNLEVVLVKTVLEGVMRLN